MLPSSLLLKILPNISNVCDVVVLTLKEELDAYESSGVSTEEIKKSFSEETASFLGVATKLHFELCAMREIIFSEIEQSINELVSDVVEEGQENNEVITSNHEDIALAQRVEDSAVKHVQQTIGGQITMLEDFMKRIKVFM